MQVPFGCRTSIIAFRCESMLESAILSKMDKYLCDLRLDDSLDDEGKGCFESFIEIALIVYKVQMTTTQFILIRLFPSLTKGQKPRKHVYQLK